MDYPPVFLLFTLVFMYFYLSTFESLSTLVSSCPRVLGKRAVETKNNTHNLLSGTKQDNKTTITTPITTPITTITTITTPIKTTTTTTTLESYISYSSTCDICEIKQNI